MNWFADFASNLQDHNPLPLLEMRSFSVLLLRKLDVTATRVVCAGRHSVARGELQLLMPVRSAHHGDGNNEVFSRPLYGIGCSCLAMSFWGSHQSKSIKDIIDFGP